MTPNETATHGHAPGFEALLDAEGELHEEPEGASFEELGELEGGVELPLGAPDGFGPGVAHAHAFEAFEGLEVTFDILAVVGGEAPVSVLEEPQTVAWSDEGLDCEEDGEGGELPETGISTGLIAVGAVVLLALGGGLYMLARRRRVTFTA